MHKLAKEIMDRVKSKINSCGIDAITEQELIEMKYWTAVADNMTSFDYHFKIIEEMEKPENQYGVNYDENGKMYYGGSRRDSRGRYMYTEPMMSDDMMEQQKGGDPYMMHYYEDAGMNSRNGGGQGNRHYYTDSKMMKHWYEHKDMGDESKKLQGLEKDLKDLSEEVTEMVGEMSNAEKQMLRTKMQNIAQKI